MTIFRQGLRGVASYPDFAPPSGAGFRVASLEGPWGDALRSSLAIRDLPVLERFRKSVKPGAQVVVPFDSHLNGLGHRLCGEALAASLREAGLAGTLAPPAAD